MLDVIKKVIDLAESERGYLEKATDSQLDDKRANAGANNFTKYARDLYPQYQGQPWCDMFVDWLFVKTFGSVLAKQMIGGFSAYTPSSAQYYKNMGRWSSSPKVGDQIFFKNDTRIYHTGIVIAVDSSNVYTIEGNTSNATEVVANGGGVYRKSYPLNHPRIAGYGSPRWGLALEGTKYTVGWNSDDQGWWYADTSSTYLKDIWRVINGHKYYFNSEGYAVTGWNNIGGKWYYFEETKGAEYECALYVSDRDGVQQVGMF